MNRIKLGDQIRYRQCVSALVLLITAAVTGSCAALPENSASQKHVVFISLAPSPYTNRHDCMRAGFGIYLLLRDRVDDNELPIRLSYFDGSQFFQDRSQIAEVLQVGDVYIMGGSTWGQGPAYYTRRFFEIGGESNLLGVQVSAWATAGGNHTGGEEVVHSLLRSMMGMGAQAFTLGQKYMVFSTDERLEPANPGYFSQFDAWYMDQFAGMIAVQSLAGNNREKARRLADRLGISPFYFKNTDGHPFPPPAQVLNRYDNLVKLLNNASNPNSEAWKSLQKLITQLK